MGQHSSLPKGRRRSLYSFVKRSSRKTTNLSHTFAISDIDESYELININNASEEELMTLSGIDRKIAMNIVEHRKAIGRFRRVEDLALVPGVGAHKLELIKPEICVSTKRQSNMSCQSSRAPSYDSLRSSESKNTITNRSIKLSVNVNTACVFDLQSVPGVTQETAASIVHYRTKKGKFRQVEDLIKVKQINHSLLSSISRYLTVDSDDENNSVSSDNNTQRPSILSNGLNSSYNGSCNGHGPVSLGTLNGLSQTATFDIFELLSTYSPRPVVKEYFANTRNGELAVRLAAWNLAQFSLEKASNLGVKEVVCRTILENGWSILAVQDVTNVSALRTICDELNRPKLRRIDEWKCNSRNWNFCMLDAKSSKLGFIYDSDNGIELLSLTEGPETTKMHCDILIATFSIDDLYLQLAILKFYHKADVNAIYNNFEQIIRKDNLVMVFSDFSELDHSSVSDASKVSLGLQSTLPLTRNTTYYLSLERLNHQQRTVISPNHMTNILTNTALDTQLTGYKDVVNKGLTHLAIPNGWSWGGVVSPYCPVWIELYTTLAQKTNL